MSTVQMSTVQMSTVQRWALAVTGVASFMVALDQLVVSTALTRIQSDLGASLGQLEWTINAFTLGFAGLLMFGAAVGDRFGRRRVFAAGMLVFVVASAGCALAPSIGWLIVGRAAQGVGGAFVMPLAMALLTGAFPPEQRAKALGMFGGITGLAVLSGPVIGGAIAQGIDWKWIFWINVPIGLIALPLTFTRLEESRGPSSLDVGGALLVTGAGLGLIWGLVRGNSVGWSSAEVLLALIAGALFAVTFVGWERRSQNPMLPMHLFRTGSFAGGNAAGFFLSAALIGFLFFVTQFLQIAQGDSPLSAGVRLLPWTATLFVVAPLSGARINRVGARPLLAGGLLLQAAGFAWIALIADPGLRYWQLIAPLVLAGCGVSMALVAAQAAVIHDVARENIGKASGAFTTLRFFGSAFGVAILAVSFDAAGGYATPKAFSDGFVAAAAAAAALSLAGAVAGLATHGRARRPADVPVGGAVSEAG
jgi:EmrB/QacA subfamily drug resistance transporter